MTHPPERAAEILRLYHAEKWPIGTIARQLGVHHGVVQRVLRKQGRIPPSPATHPSMVDPYVPFILETLTRYPTLCASRLFEMLQARGYAGTQGHFRSLVRERFRPRPAPEAYLRLRTLPGEQAQVDWAFFDRVQIGKASRQLVAFVMVHVLRRVASKGGPAAFLGIVESAQRDITHGGGPKRA